MLTGEAVANKPVVAVFEIKNSASLDKNFVKEMREIISTKLVASGRYSVLPNSEIQEALRAKKADSYKSCYDC